MPGSTSYSRMAENSWSNNCLVCRQFSETLREIPTARTASGPRSPKFNCGTQPMPACLKNMAFSNNSDYCGNKECANERDSWCLEPGGPPFFRWGADSPCCGRCHLPGGKLVSKNAPKKRAIQNLARPAFQNLARPAAQILSFPQQRPQKRLN